MDDVERVRHIAEEFRRAVERRRKFPRPDVPAPQQPAECERKAETGEPEREFRPCRSDVPDAAMSYEHAGRDDHHQHQGRAADTDGDGEAGIGDQLEEQAPGRDIHWEEVASDWRW